MKNFFAGLAVCGALALPSVTAAAVVDVDVSGISTFDLLGDADNTRLTVDVGPASAITGVSWDLELTAFDPSWLSEITINIRPLGEDAVSGVILTPSGSGNPGSESAVTVGFLIFADFGVSDLLLPDGLLELEFVESFDDFANAPDGEFGQGSVVSFQVASVPLPASGLLLLGAFAGFGAVARRRKAA